jgi:hypothetical protein
MIAKPMSLLCGVFKKKELKKWGKRINVQACCLPDDNRRRYFNCDDDFNILV